MELALGDLATRRHEDILDRIFQRDDVVVAVQVEFLDHRGQRGRFAAADRTGKKHQAVVILGQDLERLGQAEFFHRAHGGVDDAENGVMPLALPNDIGSKAG